MNFVGHVQLLTEMTVLRTLRGQDTFATWERALL